MQATGCCRAQLKHRQGLETSAYLRVKVGAGVSEQWGVSEHLLVASYFFFETTPPLLLVGLHVEATTSNRTAHF